MLDLTELDAKLVVNPVDVFLDALYGMSFDNASAAIERVANEGGALLLGMAISTFGYGDAGDTIVDHTVSEGYSWGEE